MQTGYLVRQDKAGGPTVDEMIAVPIRSTETNEVIAALVLGFKPVETIARSRATGMKSGILVGEQTTAAGLRSCRRGANRPGSGTRRRASG